jgi:nitroreductase
MFLDLVKKNRSYRRFNAEEKIPCEKLVSFVEAARYTPSACNFQNIRFAIVTEDELSDKLFGTLRFANYLKDWKGPTVSERPVAYIVLMTAKPFDTLLAIDFGICAQTILLAAVSEGYGGCIFRGFDRAALTSYMAKDGYTAELVIALGAPSETVKLVDAKGDDIKYYRDENSVHYVPKRPLDELILK